VDGDKETPRMISPKVIFEDQKSVNKFESTRGSMKNSLRAKSAVKPGTPAAKHQCLPWAAKTPSTKRGRGPAIKAPLTSQ